MLYIGDDFDMLNNSYIGTMISFPILAKTVTATNF